MIDCTPEPGEIHLTCDRCGATQCGTPTALVADEYLLDNPFAHVAALCPDCAADDDPHHVPGSWLLSWAAAALDPDEEENFLPGNPRDYGDST